MLDGQAMLLMHQHPDGKAYPMTEAEIIKEADPERAWIRPGAKLLRCTGCDEEVIVASNQGPDGGRDPSA